MIQAIAGRQHGVVARSQLLDAGLSANAIDYRVRKRRYRRLHLGVYAVGPIGGRYQREIAAVLACEGKAVLSHRSAAVLWKLMPVDPGYGWIDVTVRGGLRTGSALRVHRTTTLSVDETAVFEGVPVTDPARTIVDLAGCADPREVEQALARAERSGLAGRMRVRRVLERHPRRPGSRLLRALLDQESGPAFVRSEAEARLLSLVRKARLDRPATNVVVAGLEVDFVWRATRLVVEVDGFEFHSSSVAFERDRRRDAALTAAGFRVMRLTWRQLTGEPEAVLARLAQALVRPV